MWLEIDTHISVFPEPTELIVAILKPRKISFVGEVTLIGPDRVACCVDLLLQVATVAADHHFVSYRAG